MNIRIRSQAHGNPVALDRRNWPQNAWWVAAGASDLRDRPLQRWILGLPVVLYRQTDGTATALDDRWAPLSAGAVAGDDIACSYHGFRFAPDGHCTHAPTQPAAPPDVRIRRYPVLERGPFIWLWTGEPALAETAEPPPALDWAVDRARVTARGSMEVGCNYMALKENVLDLSHFAFVHAKTLAVTDWVRPPKLVKTDAMVGYSQGFDAMPLPAHYGAPTGIGCERPVDRTAWSHYASPALPLAGLDITDPDAAEGARRDYGLLILHATTPVDEGRCIYWWAFSQDYGHAPDAVERLTGRIAAAFLEDKIILEASESMVRRDPRGRDYPEVSVICDRPGVEARRRVATSMEPYVLPPLKDPAE